MEKKKCRSCLYFKLNGSGSPGRNSGRCNFLKEKKLPFWVPLNRTSEHLGEDCEVYKWRNSTAVGLKE